MKISFIEFIFMLSLALIGDFTEILGVLCLALPYVGAMLWFFCYLWGGVVSLILNLWIFLKGAKIFWNLSLSLADALVGGLLPLKTLGIIITYYLASKSKTSSSALILIRGKLK